MKPDGTGAIRDPLAPNQYFPNNIIPASRIDPVAANLLKYMPSSSDPNYQLRFGTPTTIEDDEQYLFRGRPLLQ